jgi:8-hydroxy-5-deazaflavin:NADPH oxidoreductase
MFSSRHPEQLAELARAAGNGAQVGTIREAATFGPVILLSVPWTGVEDALVEADPLDSKILIDTTNQWTPADLEHLPNAMTASEFNARRARGARLVKAYNLICSELSALTFLHKKELIQCSSQ